MAIPGGRAGTHMADPSRDCSVRNFRSMWARSGLRTESCNMVPVQIAVDVASTSGSRKAGLPSDELLDPNLNVCRIQTAAGAIPQASAARFLPHLAAFYCAHPLPVSPCARRIGSDVPANFGALSRKGYSRSKRRKEWQGYNCC